MEAFSMDFRNNKHFDLVVTDYKMPKNEGGRVIREILEMKPDQKILLISAYSQETLDLDRGNAPQVLPKPFDSSDFLEKIQKMLIASS